MCQMESRDALLAPLQDLILLPENQTSRSYRILGLAGSATETALIPLQKAEPN